MIDDKNRFHLILIEQKENEYVFDQEYQWEHYILFIKKSLSAHIYIEIKEHVEKYKVLQCA
jgi:hypothetical protein